MKLLSGMLAAVLCICSVGSGLADTAAAEPGAGAVAVVSEWTADMAACQPITTDTVKGLIQLAQIGKGEPITAAWSPDGETIAVAAGTGVHLFDGHTLEPLGVFASGYTKAVAWSTDSSLLALSASGAVGDQIQLWDVAAGEMRFNIKQKRTISGLYIDQENKALVALGWQLAGRTSYNSPLYKAYLDTYSLKSGKKQKDSVSFESADKGLLNLSLSAKGTVVFGAGIKETYLWNGKGKLIYSAPISYPMSALSASSADSSVILDLMSLKKLQIIDHASKASAADIALPESAARMELNEDTQELLIYTKSGYALFNFATQEVTPVVPFGKTYAGSVRLSGDKTRLFQIDGATLRLYALADNSLLGEQTGYDDRAWQVAVSGNRLAASKGNAGRKNTRLVLWDLETLAPILETGAPEIGASLSELFFLPGETELLTCADQDTKLKVWNAADGSKNREIALDGQAYGAAISADGAVLAAGFSGPVDYMPMTDLGSVRSFYLNSPVYSLSVSADGSRIAGCDGSFLIVWDAASETEALFVMDENVVAAALSADGERIAVLYSGEDGYVVKMKTVDTGKNLWTRALANQFETMCFSPDGQLLAVSAYESGLTFLNAETGKSVYTLAGNIGDFSFSQDGRLIVSASSDGTVRLWGVPQE